MNLYQMLETAKKLVQQLEAEAETLKATPPRESLDSKAKRFAELAMATITANGVCTEFRVDTETDIRRTTAQWVSRFTGEVISIEACLRRR